MADRAEDITEEIVELYRRAGGAEYFGESVTQLEHALQCADRAAQAQASEVLVIAALLHDIGHLCAAWDSPSMSGAGMMHHEMIGGAYLRERGFSPELEAIIGGHVAAKRYLVARDREYAVRLSDASLTTLGHQGGPMLEAEAEEFERRPGFSDMLRLRVWDDQAKEPGREVPPLESYREMMIRNLRLTRL